ncbi:MAG: M48 family metallopeptidase [Gammaproteobacteria bacterium]
MSFEATAAKAEVLARENIGAYKIKLFLYAILGYLVIFGLLAALIVLLAGLVFIAFQSGAAFLVLLKTKVLFLVVPVIWVLLTALWIRLEPPQGYTVTAAEFPELFGAINNITSQFKTPKIHEVLLTQELNASISQTPRLGIFGWNKNTLTLGVELLMVLSPAQASSVIGHELGHLSGNHSRFNGWIYRIRMSWFRIMGEFAQRKGFGVGMMRTFFNWYAPKFSAYSFALARANEYEADAMAAELTTSRTAGEALINVYVTGQHTEDNYWLNFFKKADEMPAPEHLPWAGLSEWLRTDEAARDDITQRLEDVLKIETGYEDTHPSLKDRLDALEVEPFVPEASAQTAAKAWLGEQYDAVVGSFDQEWLNAVGDSWQQRFEYVHSSRKTLKELGARERDDLNDEELLQKAGLTEEFVTPEEALPLYRAYQKRHPDHAAAAFSIGRLVFEQNDNELLAQMKVAINDPQLTIAACQFACATLEKVDRVDETQWWIDKANKQARINELAFLEREQLTVDDELVADEISQDEADALVELLSATPKVKRAWIAQKVVKHFPEMPVVVISVTVRGFILDDQEFANQICQQIRLNPRLSGESDFLLVPATGNFKPLAKRVEKAGRRIL